MKNVGKLLFLSIFSAHFSLAQKALVVVPIADLVGDALATKNDNEPLHTYQQMPLCGGKNPFYACLRMHQLLFNETVDIIQEQGDEVLVRIPNAFFVTQADNKKNDTFWTEKKNLMSFTTLKEKGIDLDTIPPAISYEIDNLDHKNVLTLAMPFHCAHSGLAFSAGTRFVFDPDKTTTDKYTVTCFDNNIATVKEVKIPKKRCLVSTHLGKKDRIINFVRLLRHWAHGNNGYIPYVWGGCSFNALAQTPTFTANLAKNNATYYTIDNYTATPKSGLDCSGMILRAAQICSIPYFFKNTTTIGNYLAPLQKGQALHDGDIVLFSGHVMVVGSVKNNTFIEARHYDQGYGKVQEIKLSYVFKGIETYDDLLNAYHTQQPLLRLNSKGLVHNRIPTFKLLRLESAWDNQTTA